MWNFDYTAHAGFCEPARARSELWRLIVGIILAVALILFLLFIYVGVIVQALVGGQILPENALNETGSTPAAFFVSMSVFVLISVAVFVVVRKLHKRPARTVFGPAQRATRQFAKVTGALLLLLVALSILPPWGFGEDLIPNMEFGTWLVLLPLSLLMVLIQTSAEEILFRGYMQQQLAARFRSPLVWMVIPSVLFGSLHYDPTIHGENAFIIVAWASIFGMAMADLTARSGSLGPAMAVHFVNNLSAMLIVAVPGFLDGVALYVLPFGMENTELIRAWLPVDFALICISWLTARVAIRA